MKKRVVLISAIIVVLLVAVAGVSFAAWDSTKQFANLTATVGGNVNIDVKTSDGDDMVLIPAGARNIKPGKQTDLLTVGKFIVTNKETNGTAANDYYMKIVWSLSSVQSKLATETEFTAYDLDSFNTDFDLYLLVGTTPIASGSEITLGTEYPMMIKFKKVAENVDDKTTANLIGRSFKVTFLVEAVAAEV